MSNEVNNQDMDFEELMRQRIQENFSTGNSGPVEISDERLKEMSKKLPEWSLEPPYSFLK